MLQLDYLVSQVTAGILKLFEGGVLDPHILVLYFELFQRLEEVVVVFLCLVEFVSQLVSLSLGIIQLVLQSLVAQKILPILPAHYLVLALFRLERYL